jgi:threonine dehydratase
LISLADVEQARSAVTPHVHRTPLVPSRTLSDELGVRVSLKLEMLQKTGSFKPRGVFNQIASLEDTTGGVVGFSGGNFAQAVAFAGRELGVQVRMFMPETTPVNYLEGTRGYGADVHLMPDITACVAGVRESVESGWVAVHPYDNPAMMAGNGTLGLEIAEDAPDVTDVVVSIGGGGFMTGVATALMGMLPDVRIWGVETDGAHTMRLALDAGAPVAMAPSSLARTLGAPIVAADALAAAQSYLEDVVVVSDRDAFVALEFILERAKVLTELAASCTLAAAREIKASFGDHLVLILCGGNVSAADLCELRARFAA